jgi:hypothetical protein
MLIKIRLSRNIQHLALVVRVVDVVKGVLVVLLQRIKLTNKK